MISSWPYAFTALLLCLCCLSALAPVLMLIDFRHFKVSDPSSRLEGERKTFYWLEISPTFSDVISPHGLLHIYPQLELFHVAICGCKRGG